MTDVALDTKPVKRVGRPFYLCMALLLTAIVAFGFSHTIPFDMQSPGFPIMLVVHGIVFGTWMVLFVAQPAFIVSGAVSLHRKLGMFGVALAVAMVVMGALAVHLALQANTLPPFYPPGLFITRGIVGLVLFPGLVAAGVLNRHRAEWHKRLMLCASIVVIGPGLERALPVPIMGMGWYFIVDGILIVIALFGPVYDLIVRKRIHPAYFWGIGAIVAGQAIVDVIAPLPIAAALAKAVGSL